MHPISISRLFPVVGEDFFLGCIVNCCPSSPPACMSPVQTTRPHFRHHSLSHYRSRRMTATKKHQQRRIPDRRQSEHHGRQESIDSSLTWAFCTHHDDTRRVVFTLSCKSISQCGSAKSGALLPMQPRGSILLCPGRRCAERPKSFVSSWLVQALASHAQSLSPQKHFVVPFSVRVPRSPIETQRF